MYTYFVSYNAIQDGIMTYGNTHANIENIIVSIDDIRAIEKALKDKYNYSDVVIVNFIKLSEDL